MQLGYPLSATQFFKCLSHETRLSLVIKLFQNGETCVCDLMNELDCHQAKLSQHLALLRNCGLVQDKRQGQWVYYSLHEQLPHWCQTVIGELVAGELLNPSLSGSAAAAKNITSSTSTSKN